MLMSLENQRFRVEVESLGAKIVSIVEKDTGYEYLWQEQNPDGFGASQALFPVCGPVQGGVIAAGEGEYPCPDHGLLGEVKFKLVCKDQSLICLRAESGKETLERFPYRFALKITYALKDSRISSRMKILNISDAPLLFRCGFLTSVLCPFLPGTGREEYDLRLAGSEPMTLLERDGEGLLTGRETEWTPHCGAISAEDPILSQGILCKFPRTPYFELFHRATDRYVRVQLRDAPFAGVWLSGGGQAFQLASLHGAPDSVSDPARWEQKDRMIVLEPGEEYYAHQAIEIGADQ